MTLDQEFKSILKKWLSDNVATMEEDGTWFGWDTNVGDLLDDATFTPFKSFLLKKVAEAEQRGRENAVEYVRERAEMALTLVDDNGKEYKMRQISEELLEAAKSPKV